MNCGKMIAEQQQIWHDSDSVRLNGGVSRGVLSFSRNTRPKNELEEIRSLDLRKHRRFVLVFAIDDSSIIIGNDSFE